MTIYLWHLSAMSLVAAAGLFTFDGAAFKIEPGTTAWWLTRPIWLGVLLIVIMLLAPHGIMGYLRSTRAYSALRSWTS